MKRGQKAGWVLSEFNLRDQNQKRFHSFFSVLICSRPLLLLSRSIPFILSEIMSYTGPQTIVATDLFKRYGERTVVEKFLVRCENAAKSSVCWGQTAPVKPPRFT